MLNQVAKYVDVVNIDKVMHRIRDYHLPNGFQDFEPGVVASIPTTVWGRNWRALWIKRASLVDTAEVEEVIEDEPAIERSETKTKKRGK